VQVPRSTPNVSIIMGHVALPKEVIAKHISTSRIVFTVEPPNVMSGPALGRTPTYLANFPSLVSSPSQRA
jgi:hypothetical protein